ncbi:MAG: SH3 domain-containing protein [Clostridia bacterium]|nr:SH3 domain-containing protein [Clostridia bacterium]
MSKKTFLKYIVFFCSFFIIFCTKSVASTKKDGIENFPESYRPYLQELKKKYPNWEFTALYTGLDWNYVISQEYRNNKNLVPLSYADAWKCTDNGIYNVEIDKGWVNASKRAVEFTMDPRNFLNNVRVFQFEKLSYDPNTNSKEGVEKILYGTEFYNRNVSYKNQAGQTINIQEKYSDLIWDSAIYSGVSPYHLASRIKQEVGPFITHNSISGTVAGYEGLYNFYNIGATSSTEPLGAIKNGLQFAKDGKGASEATKANLLIPWDSPQKAIKGGAVFIGSSYIAVGQNTLYLQKFDVNDDRGPDLFWHQYMTNCLAPYSESRGIYQAYESNGMLGSSIRFIIPVYENMPQYMTDSPNIIDSDYVADNTKMYANVTGTLNVRTGPSTSYEVITGIDRNRVITRIKKGVQNGERWDKVELDNGIVGYVFQSYLKEVIEESPEENPIEPEVPEEEPEEPEERPEEKPEETPEIPPIELPEGAILEFDKSLRIEVNKISNLNTEKLTVFEIKKLINTNLIMEFYNAQNEKLVDENKVGTGSKLILKNELGEIIYEYTFIIYGDINGDGEINSLDVLILQKHILEIKQITGIFLKSANTSKNGELPSSLDVLRIQKHILEIKMIEQ